MYANFLLSRPAACLLLSFAFHRFPSLPTPSHYFIGFCMCFAVDIVIYYTLY